MSWTPERNIYSDKRQGELNERTYDSGAMQREIIPLKERNSH